MNSDWDEKQATLVNSDSNADSDDDDNDSTDYDSESDEDTDDGFNAGLEETRSLLWRHITFIIVPNPTSGEPNILFAKVTLIHTKGEDNRPRK